MNIVIYATPGAFLADNQAYLRDHEVEAQLNLGNAVAHREEPCGPELLFGKVEEQGRAVLLFGNTLPWSLCLNAPEEDVLAGAAAEALAVWLQREGVAITGLHAREDLCQAFFPAYQGEFLLDTAMEILTLRELIPPACVPGLARTATLADLETVARMLQAFQREALGKETTLEAMAEKYAGRIREGKVYLFETPEGIPVSTAQTSRELACGPCISGVYTPPEHRRRGYCQTLVAHICRQRLAQGAQCLSLFVDKANPSSNRAYRKIGFQTLSNSFDYRLKEET